MYRKMSLLGCARVVPHLANPLDPLVGDPLVAVPNRTAKVENPGVKVTDSVVVEPVDSISSFCEKRPRVS